MKVFNINIFLAFQDESDLRLTSYFSVSLFMYWNHKNKEKKIIINIYIIIIMPNEILCHEPEPYSTRTSKSIGKDDYLIAQKKKKTYHESVTQSSKWIIYLHFCKAWVTTHSKTEQVSAVNLIRSKQTEKTRKPRGIKK